MVALKDLMASVGSPNIDCRQDGALFDATNRGSYLFNSTINGIDDADAILIVGANIREDAPIINARIRQRWLTGALKVGGANGDGEYREQQVDGDRAAVATKPGDGLGQPAAGAGRPRSHRP